MTTFVIGGTGQTGSRVARLLHDGGFPLLIGSRKGSAPEPFKAVRFDWSEPSTFGNPFDADPTIDRVYVVAPTFSNPLPTVKPFFDLAVSKGVKRIVVCGGSAVWKGPSLFGPMLEYISELGIEYTILRPTWFIGGFFTLRQHFDRDGLTTTKENLGSLYYESIRKRDEIFSVMEDGRVPFVSVDDIAEEAFKCLTKVESLNGEVFLLGPDLYTCDEVRLLIPLHATFLTVQ